MDINTPTADVVRIRPKIINLAKAVFGRTSTGEMQAFSCFRKSKDLADIIDAKRDEVFDYGVCIKDTDTGVTWSDPDATLAALAKAKEGELGEDDLASLNLEASDLPKLLMVKEEPKKKKTTRKRKAPAKKKTAEKKTAETPPAAQTAIDEAKERAFGDFDEALEQRLAAAFGALDERLTKRLDAVGEISGMIHGLVKDVRREIGGLYARLDILLNNQHTLAAYLDPHAELESWDDIRAEESPNQGPTDFENVEPDDGFIDPDDITSPDPDKPEDTELPPAREDDKFVEFTREDLKKIGDSDDGLEKLRTIAGELGIPKAAKIGYRAVAIRKILKVQETPA